MQLYVAFGSNLDPDQIRRRCPSAQLLGRCAIPGYRLDFAGRSMTWGAGVATLRPAIDPHSEAVGAVFRISDADLRALDGFEGHPWWYRRRRVEALLMGASRPVSGWTYLLDEPSAAPSAAYVERIAAGYRHLGLDLAVLDAAVASATEAEAARSKPTRVFVYGSLLSGMGNNHLLQRNRARMIGEAMTSEADFTMRSLGHFPAVCRGGRDQVLGELYEVDDAGLADLDRLEGHPRWYRRELVDLEVLDGSEPSVRAWAYLLDEGGPLVPNGDWRAFCSARRRGAA